jgi:transcription initiation factor IIE alpha subunit
MSMKTFEVQFRYRDRNEGTMESTVKLDASSLPGAVAKAAREFVKGLDRKQRFDMNKNGLEITVKSVGTTTEAQGETSAESAAG